MSQKINLDCRFYENEYPSKDDLVMVNIVSVDPLGSNVKLLEYNNIEGFVPSSEYSRTRVRSVARLMQVGHNVVLQVTGVDEQNGYIDLSKKFVTTEDKENLTKKFKNSLQVHGILRRLAETFHVNLIDLYKQFGWPMYKDHTHAINAFHSFLQDPTLLDKYKIEPAELKEKFLEILRHRLTSKSVKYEAEIDVTCFSFEGVEAIKTALKAGLEINKELELELSKQQQQEQEEEEEPEIEEKEGKKSSKDKKKKKVKKEKKGTQLGIVSITLLASPTYSLAITHTDKDLASKKLTDTIELIEKSIKSFNGRLQIKTQPREAAVNTKK
eukprot:TRINITY_DN4260_c0_g1_i1.p1 TRINITY_DN4260_c0_g1~~TRINITY_DN4260_c0_g1_i1.p1  ORF type:complete len:327 (-),score=110.79 TRINITY_DN4260_c0_g1_i1:64-1044(-)